MVGTELQLFGADKRFQGPLSRIFLNIRPEHPGIEKETALRLAVKALNETMGHEGLVPSFLVCLVLHRFTIVNTKLPDQVECMKALKTVSAKSSAITARIRVRKAMISKVLRIVGLVLHRRDKIRMFRGTDKKYVGPYFVERIDGIQVFVIVNYQEVQHNTNQVILENKYDDLFNGDSSMYILHTSTKQFRRTNLESKSISLEC